MTTPRLLLTLAVALVPATARAQQFPQPAPQPPQRISRQGTEVFRWLLHRAELKPVRDEDLFDVVRGRQLSDTVVILMGGTLNNQFPGGQHAPQWVTAAVEGGGAVMVVTDQQTTLFPGAGLPHVIFNGARIVTPQPAVGPWLVLNQNEVEQFVVPFDPPPGGGPEWELFGGERPLRRVVTELPASLAGLKGGTLTPLAGFPPNARFRDGLGLVAPTGNVFAAGVAGRHPRTRRGFRFLAVADPAVFHNAQMVASDHDGPTDNLEFADRAIRFLSEEDGQKRRTKCLLINNGQVERDYDRLNQLLRPPLPPLPKVDWEKVQPKLVDLGNHLLDKVQENNIPNQLLVGKNPDAPGSWYRTLLGVLLTISGIWAAFALVRRVWGAREPTDLAGAPPGGRPPPPPDGAAGVFGRRGKELATRDNLLEPARAACRDLFDTVGRPPEPGPRLPKVIISDVVRKPDTLRQALRDIWAVAYGRPTPVTAMRWAALEPLLARALAAHRDGKWRFVEAEAWPDVSTRSRGEA